MKSRILKLMVVTVILSAAVCGCQKAPERTDDGAVFRAKNSLEKEVDEIVGKTGMENDIQEIDCVIGAEENSIRIQARMPGVPENVYSMVLKENNALTKEALTDFLESDSGKIEDLSEETKKQAEQSEKENEQSEERVRYSVFGDTSICHLSDGQKEAVFSHGTSAYYEDRDLYEKCMSVYKSMDEMVLNKREHTEEYGEIEELILDKLSKIEVTEIYIYEVVRYQNENVTCYEVKFTPAYGGMGLLYEFGSVSYGEVYPAGRGWICDGGIASLALEYCLGKAEQQEKCAQVLSWEQVAQILEVHLEHGKINGSEKAVLTEVEFLYYPILREDENKLELVPIWHIYTPLSAWVENKELAEEFTTSGAAWSICINAVSGEVVRSE